MRPNCTSIIITRYTGTINKEIPNMKKYHELSFMMTTIMKQNEGRGPTLESRKREA
jgi:hypothetical protein